jgi:hypothetical protein
MICMNPLIHGLRDVWVSQAGAVNKTSSLVTAHYPYPYQQFYVINIIL